MSDFAGEEAARAIRSALERCNARAAFGLPGAGNQVLFQALRSSGIRLVVPTHELAAAFMAGAYGRVAGLPGILLTIRGPGFAYALAGIAEAWQDSAPMVHIVSAPPEDRHLRHRHQALDQAAIVRPIVKAVFGVTEPADLYETVGLAFEAARSGEPGPVVVQLGAKVDTEASAQISCAGQLDTARAVWARIHRARKPVLMLGQGCVGNAAAIARYVERTGTPVFTTASGRGVIPESSPWCLGYDSLRRSTRELNTFLREADLVIAIGARLAFNGTAGFGVELPPERLVHVDASASSLNAVYQASDAAVMTAEEFFELPESVAAPRTLWTAEALAPWRAKIRLAHRHDPEPGIAGDAPEHFFARLRKALPDDALIVTDSGLHQVLARRYFEVREPHGLLLPTDLQSMGFALPSAIAAKLAAPARRVVALVGDGGALMSGLELAVAVRERIALTAVVFNDGYLNQIRLQQLEYDGRSYGVALPRIDFKALAEATGARYLACSSSILECMESCSSDSGVTLIEVPVTDSAALRVRAAARRGKAVVRSALGARWDVLRRLLRR